VVARSVLDAQAVAAQLKDSVAALDPTLPVQAATLDQTVYGLAQRPRFSASLLLLFAVMGMLLAAAGIYGLVSLLVTQRTQEIAIHIALGANPRVITQKIVAQSVARIALGAVAGILCSLPAERWIRALRFGIKPNDPATLIEAILALVLLAILAAYIPARRAAKVDPMAALRYE
jgi:ABC-type antimicrobial peptide transport system permease subunit